MKEQAYVYIITNKINTVLYIGVTSNLVKRIFEHKNKTVEGFSKRYNLNKLVYFEQSDSIVSAIEREKYLKGKKRKFKEDLINSSNSEWRDLYEEIS
jgi:putative endonuclease